MSRLSGFVVGISADEHLHYDQTFILVIGEYCPDLTVVSPGDCIKPSRL